MSTRTRLYSVKHAAQEEDTHLGAAAGRSNSHLLHDGSECSRQDQQPCSSTLAPATPAASGRPDAGDSLWEPRTDMIWGAPASTLRSPSPQRQPDSYSATRRGWQAGRQVCSSTSQGVAAGRGLPAGPQADVFAEVRLGWEARSRSGSAEAEFGQGSSAALLPEPTSQMDPWSPLPCGISAKRSPVLQLLDGAPADWIGEPSELHASSMTLCARSLSRGGPPLQAGSVRVTALLLLTGSSSALWHCRSTAGQAPGHDVCCLPCSCCCQSKAMRLDSAPYSCSMMSVALVPCILRQASAVCCRGQHQAVQAPLPARLLRQRAAAGRQDQRLPLQLQLPFLRAERADHSRWSLMQAICSAAAPEGPGSLRRDRCSAGWGSRGCLLGCAAAAEVATGSRRLWAQAGEIFNVFRVSAASPQLAHLGSMVAGG